MTRARVLAIAVAFGRIGYVLLVNRKLYSWQLSRQAAYSESEAARFAKLWIARLRPDLVITEDINDRCRKAEIARGLIQAIAAVADAEPQEHIIVERPRTFRNKYLEAMAFAERFPDLRSRVPKPRKVWDSEDRNTTIFEALALALEVVDREDDTLR